MQSKWGNNVWLSYPQTHILCVIFFILFLLQYKRELRDYLNKQAEISKNGGSSGGGGGAGGAGTKPKGSGEDVSSTRGISFVLCSS